jgi:hypothetical protein
MSKKTEFSTSVELYVQENDCKYITAILDIAEQQGIDEDAIPKYISDSLKEKLYIEGVNDRTLEAETDSQPQDLSEWF